MAQLLFVVQTSIKLEILANNQLNCEARNEIYVPDS
jgi:hypothetical protein